MLAVVLLAEVVDRLLAVAVLESALGTAVVLVTALVTVLVCCSAVLGMVTLILIACCNARSSVVRVLYGWSALLFRKRLGLCM